MLLPILSFYLVIAPGAEEEVGFIRPESYAITRFQEVIDESLNESPKKPKDLLIRNRALLAIAQKALQQNEDARDNPASPPGLLSYDNLVRAGRAQVHHYQKQVDGLRARIIASKKRNN